MCYVLWANLSIAFLARFELWAKAFWANISLLYFLRTLSCEQKLSEPISLSCTSCALWAVSKSFLSQYLSLVLLAHFELWAKALWANLSLVLLALFELWAKAFWANISLSLPTSLSCSPARRLTSSLLSSQRRCKVASLYAALLFFKIPTFSRFFCNNKYLIWNYS